MKREARLGETSGQVLSASAKKLRFRTQRSRPNCFEPAGRIRPDRLVYCARRHIASRRVHAICCRSGCCSRRIATVAWWDRVWPPAALGVALLMSLVWVALLGYGIARLL